MENISHYRDFRQYLVPYRKFELCGNYLPTEDGMYFDLDKYYHEKIIMKNRTLNVPKEQWPSREEVVQRIQPHLDENIPIIDILFDKQYGKRKLPLSTHTLLTLCIGAIKLMK